jgi:hypothetical protein
MRGQAVRADYSDVAVATREDLLAGVQDALDRLGLSLDELHEQAVRGSFGSETARLLWLAIAPPGERGQAC